MRLELVNIRLKPEERDGNVKITGPADAADFLLERMGGEIVEDSIYAVHLNTKGYVRAVSICSYEAFRQDQRVLLAESVLSNSAAVILGGKNVSPEMENLLTGFISSANVLGSPCIDYIDFAIRDLLQTEDYVSYRISGMLNFDGWDVEDIPKAESPVSADDIDWEIIKLKLNTEKYLSEGDVSKEDAVSHVIEELSMMDREYFSVMSFKEGEPVNVSHAHIGNIDSTPASPREIMKVPLLSGADSMIVLHNHPSGDPTPSRADREAIDRVAAAAGIFGIEMEDSIIVGGGSKTVFSMKKDTVLNDKIEYGNDSHKQIERMREKMILRKEFDWQGIPFKRYIGGYIEDSLKEISGKEVFLTPSYIATEIMKPDMDKDFIFEGGEYEALSFIKEHFWEAVDTQETLSSETEGNAIDPFSEPEKFAASMIEMAACGMLSENEYINDHFDERIRINENVISDIMKGTGIGNDMMRAKELTGDTGIEME